MQISDMASSLLADGEPLPPDQLLKMNERSRGLAALAMYFEDADPTASAWNGPELRYR
jgi:hypothetical protein